MRRIVHRTDGDMAQLLALLRSGSSSRPQPGYAAYGQVTCCDGTGAYA